MGVTVTFIAILELMREGLIEIVQTEVYQPIHVRPVSAAGRLAVVGGTDMAGEIDADAENEAALAQPELPDENDDPDEDHEAASRDGDSATTGQVMEETHSDGPKS